MVTDRIFGTLSAGERVKLYHLENKEGAYAEVSEFGAVLVRLAVRDKNGVLTDVVLGHENLDDYVNRASFFGATVGRNGNRIEGAAFSIYGKEYMLADNENGNNLHSGPGGYEKKLWETAEVDQEENSVTFTRISPDGENGFPGEFDISVKYELTDDNVLRITYHGVSDQPTVANMTNHSFFNLDGEGSGSVLDQYMKINAAYYTPVRDSASIPTGEYAPVDGTPMDFRTSRRIGERIDADFEQLKFTGGYDHNYVTDNYARGNVRPVARAFSEKSGIVMDVSSDCPCVQLYAGNFISGEPGKNGHVYEKRDGFCLETQVEPNAINEENFHSPVLEEGEFYHSVTTYSFSVKK